MKKRFNPYDLNDVADWQEGNLDKFIRRQEKRIEEDICVCGTKLVRGVCGNPACEYNSIEED